MDTKENPEELLQISFVDKDGNKHTLQDILTACALERVVKRLYEDERNTNLRNTNLRNKERNMNTKEKLTEIISNVVVNDKGNRIRDVFHPEFVQKIVEDLIKHDVKTVVRCKDCSYYLEMTSYDYNGKKARHCFCHSQLRRETDYCSDGIRKGGETDA